ncbi:exodeoxyribonuclease V subunit gamma [Prochlorococcus sp. MIT 1223]|uniref:exodeoxyribonuclease V subunit gamma n=1 Tax=Prochlorococcus sp. MIT 1223 TaxID=3096217 RepID=UPI002A766853|nr:exodeoxyribonuclease V subunit gamma [Prochlorococcus sp. MIT 1223]
MLTIYRSNRAEWLAKLLAEQLRLAPPNVCRTVEVMVNTWPTSRWLGEQIALTNGINSQTKFPFPGSCIRSLVYKVLEVKAEEIDRWSTHQLIWPLLEELPNLVKYEEASDLKDWIDNKKINLDELNIETWKLAKSIAEVFDDYILYRPDLIQSWLNLETQHERTPLTLTCNEKWQQTLFRLISKKIGSKPLCIHIKRAIEILKVNNISDKGLPNEIHLFGITTLAPIQIEFLQALSGSIDIQIFLLTPCKDLWQRFKQRRDILSSKWNEQLDELWLLKSPRLEATFGRMGAEFQQLLEGTGESQLGEIQEEDLFALPAQISRNNFKKASLLEQLQERLVSEENKIKLKRDKTDESILFIEAPGLRRQVQLVRDQIIRWLAKDETLQPRDIIIMTPQVNRFSPLINSIFNDVNATGIDIPWRITDRSQEDNPGLIHYMIQLLEISEGRITASALDSLLSNLTLQKQNKFSQEDLINITTCLQETGFRWGIDASERDGDETHSLNWCLDRWLMGLILPSLRGLPPNGIAPFSEGMETDEIIKWWHLLSDLSNQISEIRKSRTATEWVDLLKNIVDQSFGNKGDWAWEYQSFVSEIESFHDAAKNFKKRIPCSVIKDMLKEKLSKSATRFGHRTGKVTISALEPMRAIPHRIIILMGLDENIFPRKDIRPSFHLFDHTYSLGDKKTSDQDRYVLLEALISCRQHLLLTWNSRDERTGDRIEPSCPVQQLLEFINNELGKEYEGVLRKPPCNPLDKENFKGPSLSCDKRDLGACLLLNEHQKRNSIGIGMPLEWDLNKTTQTNILSNKKLKEWLIAPQLTWLAQNQLRPKEWEKPIQDLESLSLDNLQRYKLMERRLIELYSKSDIEPEDLEQVSAKNFWKDLLMGKGVLPPKAAGDIEIALLETRWQNIYKIINEIGEIRNQQLLIDDDVNTYQMIGDVVLTIEVGRLKSKNVMSSWLNHLLISANGMEIEGSLIIARKSKEEYGVLLKLTPTPQDEAISILTQLRSLANQGLERCWPVPPESGWAFAKAKQDSPEKAIKSFKEKWNGAFKMEGERKNAEMQLCFGSETDPSIFLESMVYQQAIPLMYDSLIKNLSFKN